MTAFLLALAAAAVLTGALLPLLRRWRLHDVPNDRSSHTAVTPRGGGIALLAAVLVTVPLVRVDDPRLALVVLLPAVVCGLVGLVDDVRSLGSMPRLLLQSAVAVGTCLAAASVVGDVRWWPAAFLAVSTVGVVAYVNAFNFMDGVNGISALTAAVCGGWLAWVGSDHGIETLVVVGAALAGAALGFLPWNATSRVFLGDVGSYGVGALIAAATVVGWLAGVPAALVLAPLLVYLGDTGWVLFKRARARQPLMEAHRGHAYQRLVALGWPHLASASWTAALAAVCCFAAAVLIPWGPVPALLASACVVLVHLGAPRFVARRSAARELVS